ncbi:MAG: hypothetical protein QOF52_1557 [Propionibacteriaceae bacterium]|nr:hypothetical protein [Propionibacteriaceae bacterium]
MYGSDRSGPGGSRSAGSAGDAMLDVGARTVLSPFHELPLITAETATRRSAALAATMTGSLLDFQVLARARLDAQ